MPEMDMERDELQPVYSGMERILKLELARVQQENKELTMRVMVLEGQLKERDDE